MKPKIAIPKDLKEQMREWEDEHWGEASDPVKIVIEHNIPPFQIKGHQDIFLLPQNTAGSDDYHVLSLSFAYNLDPVFDYDCSIRHAAVTAYVKRDMTATGFFVFHNAEKNQFHVIPAL